MKMRECLYFLFVFLTCETLPMIVPPETDCYNKGFICYDEDRFYQCVDIGNKTVTMGDPQFCPEGLKCNDNDEIECGEPWSAENVINTSMAIHSTTLKSNIQTDEFEESDTYDNTDDNTHDKIKHTDSLSPGITISPINTISTTVDEFVIMQNSTDQFLEINNQYVITNKDIQTEPNLLNEETEFLSEFNKLTITTDKDTKLPPLESNEFVDVQTTKLPPAEDTDESPFGWKEPIWEPEGDVELENAKNIHTTEVETVTPTVMTDAPEDADYEYIYDFWNEDIAEENPTTIHDPVTTNEEKVSTTGITANPKSSTGGLIFHDISFPTTIDYEMTTRPEVLKSTTEESETITGNDQSNLKFQNFNFTTEQNEISASTEEIKVTLNLETQNSKTVAPVDDEQSTLTQNMIASYQTFQQENSKYTNTENKLFTFETETATAETVLTEGNTTHESADNKNHSTQTWDESTESKISLSNYTNGFITSEEYAISTTFKTIEGFTTSDVTPIVDSGDQTTSGYVEEIKIKNTLPEVVTSDTDTTLSVESQEISRIFTTTESDLISSSEDNEEVTSTQRESTINSILNSTKANIFEYVSTNVPTITTDTLQGSKTTVTELYNLDTDSTISTGTEMKFVTTDWYISKDIDELVLTDENQNSQSTFKSNTVNTETVTDATLDNVSNTKEDTNFRSESATEVMTRQTTDATSGEKSEVFEELTAINETPTYNTKTSTSFTSGIFAKELTTEINILPGEISQPLTTLIIETTTVSVETDSFIDQSNLKEIKTEVTEATPFETRTTPLESEATVLESEGLSSIQENILDADISTIRVKELDDVTENSYIHSTSSEVSTTERFRDQENTQEIYTTKESKLNVTPETVDLPYALSVENSTYSLLDLSITTSSSSISTQKDNTESTTDNKDVVEVNNFTTKDTLTETEIQESSRTTDLISTLSTQEINTINNSTPSTEFEVTTRSSSFLTNHINNTKISVNVSIEVEEDNIFYGNEVSTVSLSLNTTEPVTSEEESSLSASETAETLSTSSDVITTSSSEMPYILTTRVTINPETSDTEFSSNEFSSTIAPVSSFTCLSVGKFPDPKSCSKFYLCINAFVKYIAVALDCPKGTLFDSAVKECTRRPVQCPGETLLTCTTSGVYPHPTDCSRYYKCLWRSFNKNFTLKQFKCPRGTRYHSKNRRCERTNAVECVNSFVPEIADDVSFKCVEVGRFAVESSCKEYYECKEKNSRMISYRKTCSESKLFDAEWGRCRKSHLVVCPFGDYDSRDTSEIDDRSVECA